MQWKEGGDTFCELINCNLIEINLLCMGAEIVSCIAEEVLPDLSLTQLSKVCLISVNTTARFIDFDHSDGFVVYRFLIVESTHQVAVEAFGAEG